ncbi:MAG: hypothetical protein J5938_00450 [Clostridia bacterium]|nr:hypothetical protein [Clostridia bacterium]
MSYLYLLIAAVLFSMQHFFLKQYEKKSDGTSTAAVWTLLIRPVTLILFLTVLHGVFPIWEELGGFFSRLSSPEGADASAVATLIASVAFSVAVVISLPCAILVMRHGKLLFSTASCQLGSFLVPFLYGVTLCGEPLSVPKTVGLVLIVLSLLLIGPNLPDFFLHPLQHMHPSREPGKEKEKKKGYSSFLFFILCFLLFVTSGTAGVGSAASQKVENPLSTDAFLILCMMEIFVMAVLILLGIGIRRVTRGEKGALFKPFWAITKERFSFRTLLFLGAMAMLYGFSNGFANIFSMLCAKTMDYSIQFPLLSATMFILSAMLGPLFFHEKLEKMDWIKVALAVAGLACFFF